MSAPAKCIDIFGLEITPGSYVLYACASGRGSARMKFGKVKRVIEPDIKKRFPGPWRVSLYKSAEAPAVAMDNVDRFMVLDHHEVPQRVLARFGEDDPLQQELSKRFEPCPTCGQLPTKS